jgi:hypothetical protein
VIASASATRTVATTRESFSFCVIPIHSPG